MHIENSSNGNDLIIKTDKGCPVALIYMAPDMREVAEAVVAAKETLEVKKLLLEAKALVRGIIEFDPAEVCYDGYAYERYYQASIRDAAREVLALLNVVGGEETPNDA